VLTFLKEHGGLTIKQISEAMGIKPARVQDDLSHWEERGKARRADKKVGVAFRWYAAKRAGE